MSDQLDVLRRLALVEGYRFDADQFHHTTAQAPDTVCALMSAVGAITTADAQIAALRAAADVLWEVYEGPRPADVTAMRERLAQVTDALARALAERDTARSRLRRECKTLADLGTALISPAHNAPPTDQPDDADPPTP
ncbi:hypothetical protein ACVCAH_32950 [Micromonospora sp. LZ34]